MSYNNSGYQQGQGGHGDYQQQPPYQQGGYQQQPYQGDHQQQGYHQQGGYNQQGGHQQSRPGLAESYYSEPSVNQQQQHYPPPGYGQHPQQGPGQGPGPNNQGYPPQYDNQGGPAGADGPDGERGVMGALAGGAAGAFGGYKVGGKTGHTKTSAVIGAVAGAFAGHKLQDAVSDWKDDRDEKKEKEEEEEKKKKKRRDSDHRRRRSRSRSRSSRSSSRSSRSGESPRSGRFAGHFTASSRDIRLDTHGDYVLHASCKRDDGSYQHSSISLDRILENDSGSFRWSGGRRSGGHGGPSTVTVQHGDTLRGIAARFNCSFEEIARHNGINNPDLIYPGQTLQVPGGGGSSGGDGNFAASARHVRLTDGGQRLEAELRRDGDWVLSSIILDERIVNRNGTLELI